MNWASIHTQVRAARRTLSDVSTGTLAKTSVSRAGSIYFDTTTSSLRVLTPDGRWASIEGTEEAGT